MVESLKGLPILAFRDAAAWGEWLAANGAESLGVWLKLAKKASGAQGVSRKEAVLAALAHGWIDGQAAPIDQNHWLQRFTPRGPKSRWSKINCENAERLIAEGAMTGRGLAAVASAKADGRWDAAYPSPAGAQTPEDFAKALAANARAQAFFAELSAANRYALLYRLHHARPAARAGLVERFVGMLERGETFHPQRRPA